MSRLQNCVAILSDHDDLHALAAKKVLNEREDVKCYVIECDRISESGGLVWGAHTRQKPASALRTTDGDFIEVSTIDVMWFRRYRQPQLVPDDITEPAHLDMINKSTPAALLGTLLSDFSGRWINDPYATFAAENKLLQLRVAQHVGIPTPRTLVSNNPAQIRQFCSLLANQVIIKPLYASRHTPTLTQRIRHEHLKSDERLRLCPAIYQEYIEGRHHLRVHIFGNYVSAILIESSDIDWRVNLDVPCRPYELDKCTESKLRHLMAALNLRMGIIDLKLNDTVPTWLEINPQGQFLFAEGLTGMPLTDAISDFLLSESRASLEERTRLGRRYIPRTHMPV